MRIARLHSWPQTPARAIALQRALASRVRLRPPARLPRLLAGVDVAFPPDGGTVVAGVVLWDAQTGCVIEHQVARAPCPFPYVPGLLSFRELPAVLRALRRLRSTPDAVLCDAQGLAHPRRLGLACHLGLWVNVPTVGCAKSRLIGEHVEPGPSRGSGAPLLLDGAPVGVVLRTRDGVRPLFVSPGHLCDIAWAERVTLLAAVRYRLPEPTRLAHQLVTRSRRLAGAALPRG